MKNLTTIKRGGELRLAIKGVTIVSIDGINIAIIITRRPPNLLANQPPGIFKINTFYNKVEVFLLKSINKLPELKCSRKNMQIGLNLDPLLTKQIYLS